MGFTPVLRDAVSGTLITRAILPTDSGAIAQGAITSGLIAAGAVSSGNIASGQVGTPHLSSGAVNSGQIASGQVSQFKMASGAINSGHIASGAIQGAAGATRNIASGTVAHPDFGSGAVQSGDIASGQIGQNHISSGAITSGKIGDAAVVSGSYASGSIASGHLASGLIANLGSTIGSGSVQSGMIASGAVMGAAGTQPNIVSGTVFDPDFASGARIVGALSIWEWYTASETISGVGSNPGVIPVAYDTTGISGAVIMACAAQSGRMPAIGVVNVATLSGQPVKVFVAGIVPTPKLAPGTLYFVGLSGDTGAFDMSHPPTASGAILQQIGYAVASSGLFNQRNFMVALETVASGTITSQRLGSGAVSSGKIGDNAVQSGNIGSGQIASGHFASGLISGILASIAAPNFAAKTQQVLMSGLLAAENLSGAIAFALNTSGQVIQAMAALSGRMPAIGVTDAMNLNIASGQPANVVIGGRSDINPINTVAGQPFYVGLSGDVAQSPPTLSGAILQELGIAANASTRSGLFISVTIPGSGDITGQRLGSGAVISGKLGDASVISGSVASGQIGQFHHASGAINSGHVASGSVGGQAGPTINIQSGTIRHFDFGSGAVQSGDIASGQIGVNHLASGSVTSGAIASGQVGINHLGSGSVTSGAIASGQIGQNHLGSGAVTSGAIASGQVGVNHHASGSVASGHIASGAVQGSLGAGADNVASGTVGPNDLGSGAILSGAIASGQVGANHLASGVLLLSGLTSLTARLIIDDFSLAGAPLLASENISGIRAVNVTQSGTLQIAMPSVSGRMPVIGVTVSGALSGLACSFWTQGFFQASSGMVDFSGRVGSQVWVSRSGQLAPWSGSHLSGGLSSGDIQQQMGVAINSGGFRLNIRATDKNEPQGGPGTFWIFSGDIASGQIGKGHISSGAVASGQVGDASVNSGNLASGSVAQSHVASGAINSGQISSGAVVGAVGAGRTVASGTLAHNDFGSGAVLSGDIASGQIGQNHLASGAAAAGAIGSGAVLSGNIASGQIADNHFASGAKIKQATWIQEMLVASENMSGSFPLAVASDRTGGSGWVVLADPQLSGRMPAIGVINAPIASGVIGPVILGGIVIGPALTGKGAIYVTQSGRLIDSAPTSGYIQIAGATVQMSGNVRGVMLNMTMIGPAGAGVSPQDPDINSFRMASGAIRSGHIASGQIGTNHLSSGIINSGQIADNAVVSGSIASGSVGRFHLASGAVGSGDLGNGAVVSGSIASGSIFTLHLAATTVAPFTEIVRNDQFNAGEPWNGASGEFAVAFSTSGVIVAAKAALSGRMPAIGVVIDSVASGSPIRVYLNGPVTSPNFNFSGQIGLPLFVGNSGELTSIPPSLSGSVRQVIGIANSQSGMHVGHGVASGMIDRPLLASGAVTSGAIGAGGTPDGTKVLRDDFTWASVVGVLASGNIGSGYIASGSVDGFFGPSRRIQSGTVGVFDFGSGAVIAGTVGSGAVQSGNIASGSIGPAHMASGAIQSGSIGSGAVLGSLGGGAFTIASGTIGPNDLGSGAIRSGAVASGQIGQNHMASGFYSFILAEWYTTAETISGVKAVTFASGDGSTIVRAERQSGLRLPAFGVTMSGAVSGSICLVVILGPVTGGAASGAVASGFHGRPLYCGSGGHIVNASGFMGGSSSGAPTLSGSMIQRLGMAISGGMFVNPDVTITSGLQSGLLMFL